MATQRWESCIYTAEQERDFLNNLGPTMEAAGYGDKKIVVWDYNRDLITHRANAIFDDPDAAKYAGVRAFTGTKPGPAATPNTRTSSSSRRPTPTSSCCS